ncbi:MAG: restriction endonuclease subunit S, partial [Verrucomicrobiia bacterium]
MRIRKSGFPVFKVGDAKISTNVVDGPFGTQLKVEEYQETGVPLLRVSNCRSGEVLDDDEMVYISEEKHQQLIRSEVLPGDVLLTKAGHILGYSAVFPKSLKKGNITSHLASIRPAKGVVPEFLATYLTSGIGIAQIYRWGNKATRPELNTNEVRELLVPLPSPEVQNSLVAKLKAARSAWQQKLVEADALLAGFDGYLLAQLGLAAPALDARQVFAVRLGQINRQRLDSFFYKPNLIKNEAVARKYKPVFPLAKLLSKPPMNGLDARDYLDAGQRYLRVQNVKPFELVFDD